MSVLLAGLALGAIGSGHCAAMCGPLVALASRSRTEGGRSACGLAAHVARYHFGRALTYLLLGVLIGNAGGALTGIGFGRGLAIVSGMLLVGHALASTRGFAGRLALPSTGAWVTRRVAAAGRWMRARRLQGPMLLGALNGLLPCGLVYAALTAGAGFGDATLTLLFMAGFALGTTPVLAVTATAGGAIGAVVPQRWRRLAPVAVALVGVLLIVRGMTEPHTAHTQYDPPSTAFPAAAHLHAPR